MPSPEERLSDVMVKYLLQQQRAIKVPKSYTPELGALPPVATIGGTDGSFGAQVVEQRLRFASGRSDESLSSRDQVRKQFLRFGTPIMTRDDAEAATIKKLYFSDEELKNWAAVPDEAKKVTEEAMLRGLYQLSPLEGESKEERLANAVERASQLNPSYIGPDRAKMMGVVKKLMAPQLLRSGSAEVKGLGQGTRAPAA